MQFVVHRPGMLLRSVCREGLVSVHGRGVFLGFSAGILH